MTARFVVERPYKARHGYKRFNRSGVVDFLFLPESHLIGIIDIELCAYYTIERTCKIGRDSLRLNLILAGLKLCRVGYIEVVGYSSVLLTKHIPVVKERLHLISIAHV